MPPSEDGPMLHAFYYPRDLITERVRFTPADHAQITHCRGVHNRLGFAYQMGFVRLTGRFPAQHPLEMLHDLLVWVAREVGIDPSAIEAYAQRRQTVSQHQLLLQGSLGLRPCGPAERDLLVRFIREEALRLESTPALIAQAEAFLRAHSIVLPAGSTLRRVVGEQREQARHLVYTRLLALMPSTLPPRLDALLQVEASHASSLQALKAPPGFPSARALLRLLVKLEQIHSMSVLALDLSCLNNNLQTTFARQVAQASAYRLRELLAPQRYTLLVCFLRHTYRETLDHLVDMYTKLVTATYRRAQHTLDTGAKRHRPMIRAALQSFQTIGQALLNEQVPPDAVRMTVFAAIPPERSHAQMQKAQQWRTGESSAVFPLVLKRYSYFRQFAPQLLDRLRIALEPTGSPALLEAVALLRDLNTTGQRTLPEEPPTGHTHEAKR